VVVVVDGGEVVGVVVGVVVGGSVVTGGVVDGVVEAGGDVLGTDDAVFVLVFEAAVVGGDDVGGGVVGVVVTGGRVVGAAGNGVTLEETPLRSTANQVCSTPCPLACFLWVSPLNR